MVGAFRKLIETDITDGCYNVATSEHRTLRSYVEEMKEVTGNKSSLLFGAVPYGMDVTQHVLCVVDKINRTIGWNPKVTFAGGVRKMAGYYKMVGVGDRK